MDEKRRCYRLNRYKFMNFMMLLACFTILFGCMVSIFLSNSFANEQERPQEVIYPSYMREIEFTKLALTSTNEEVIEEEVVAPAYSEEELRWMTVGVFHEARDCSDEHQQYVAQVMLNRVNNPRIVGDDLYSVLTWGGYANGQVFVSEAEAERIRTEYPEEYLRCEANALKALLGEVDMPDSVIYQANFRQGHGVWKEIEINTPWYQSTTYFCHE